MILHELVVGLSVDDRLAQQRVRFEQANQGHIFQFLPQLTQSQKEQLLAELEPVDPVYVNKSFTSIAQEEEKRKQETIVPFTGHTQVLADTSSEERLFWRNLGLYLIKRGSVGAVLMAGGQGTRLGSDKPKGMFDIGLPSHKSIFQLQAEKLMRLRELARNLSTEEKIPNQSLCLPWYILTSESTHDTTKEFFEQHNYWGLPRDDVFFFEQDLMPCLTKDGKILMESMSKMAKAPNGNGGVHSAIANSVPNCWHWADKFGRAR